MLLLLLFIVVIFAWVTFCATGEKGKTELLPNTNLLLLLLLIVLGLLLTNTEFAPKTDAADKTGCVLLSALDVITELLLTFAIVFTFVFMFVFAVAVDEVTVVGCKLKALFANVDAAGANAE